MTIGAADIGRFILTLIIVALLEEAYKPERAKHGAFAELALLVFVYMVIVVATGG